MLFLRKINVVRVIQGGSMGCRPDLPLRSDKVNVGRHILRAENVVIFPENIQATFCRSAMLTNILREFYAD